MIRWLHRAETIRWLWVGFLAALALTVLAQVFVEVHGAFGLETSFGFSAWFGFLACVLMIVVAKLLGALLKRPDTYYDEE